MFRHLTGLSVGQFDAPAADLVPDLDARRRRLDRPDRARAVGGGDTFDLPTADQVLAAVIRLRHYPTQECLGFLFGGSDAAARRAAVRSVPALADAGRDGIRMPDPGRGRTPVDRLLADGPGLAAVVDTSEQPTHRPGRGQRAYPSGKKKRHALKAQVVADEETGEVCHTGRPGPGRGRTSKSSGGRGGSPGCRPGWSCWATAATRGSGPRSAGRPDPVA